MLPWFVGVGYLAYLVRSAAILNDMNPGLVTLPMLFALDAAFRAWFDSKAKHREELAALQKRSLEKLAALHQRTLETLAVAIDGRDHTTHMHLRRVQFYVRAVGQELKLSEEQLEHLNVAALAARYRQAGDSRPHSAQARSVIAGRVGEDEDPSDERGGYAGAHELPRAGAANRGHPS